MVMQAGPGTRGAGWWSTVIALVYAPFARFLGVLAVAIFALIIGGIGLDQYLTGPHAPAGFGHSFWDIVFYDLQLPVLSSAPTQGPGPYPVLLGIARILAPVSTFLAAVGTLFLLLGEQWRRVQVAAARYHAIVVGDGPVALKLAGNLHAEKRKLVLLSPKVVLVSSDDETLTRGRQAKLVGYRGDPSDPVTLRAARVVRATELYACTSQGTVNAAIALRARDEVPASRKQPLRGYAQVRDAELGVALRARRIGVGGDPRLRLDFFTVEDIAARRLFGKHPLTSAGDGPVQVVISGFGYLGQAVLIEVAHQQQALPGRPPADVVIRHASEEQVMKLADAFPAIRDNCSITYAEPPAFPAVGEYTVYVCLDADDDDALSEGLAMAHSLVSRRGHVVVCMRESSPFAGVLAARSGLIDDVMGKLSVFGVIEEACVPSNIRDDFTEQLARSIHGAYVAMEAADGNTPATNPSMVPWESLPEDLRRANIDQAADIGYKMEAIGAIIVPQSAGAPEFQFTDEEVERLAEQEHERWMRDRLSQGWRYGQPRDDERKIHPDLQPWAALSEADKDKDRNAIRTLPGTLHDAGFQILRLPPDS
jgi:RyR domain-containing protein/TrkA family protein